MSNINTLVIIIASLTAVAVLLQVVSLVAMAIIAGRAVKELKRHADEFRALVAPVAQHSKDLLQHSKHLIERLEPKLDAAATDLAEIARIANEEARKIKESADVINERIRRQAEHVDGIATNALNSVDRASQVLNEAVNVPIRQISGLLAAFKAIVETLRSPAPPKKRARPDAPAETQTGQFV